MSAPRGADGKRDATRPEAPPYRHSGPGNSSLPRRAGTGERQAPYVDFADDQSPNDLPLIPGEVLYGKGPVVINAGKDTITIRVVNTADRPIQIGSHYHFAEVNPALDFDREAAWGRRLNVLAGGSMRFEPGAVEEAELIPIGGERIVAGLRGACGGKLDDQR
ncbi:MAG TPA: urease subunit beta [Thermomicrobiales bacterium]|nr:urease subunit beta [Thermomicrobiales bacterium]